MIEGKRIGISIWWQAFRYHFVLFSIFPPTLGGLISWAINRTSSLWYFPPVLVDILINRTGLNMTDDDYSFRQPVDQLKTGGKEPPQQGNVELG